MPELGKTVQAGGCTRKLRKHDSAVCSFVEVVNAFVQKAIDLTGVGGLLLAAAGRVSPRQATSFLAARQERRQRNVPYIQRPPLPRKAGQWRQPALTTNTGVRRNLYGRLPCGKQIFEVLTRRFIAVLYPAFALWIGCPIYCWP